MKYRPSTFGILAVVTIANMTLSCVTTEEDPDANVSGECHGVNNCKGQGECGGKGTSCAGTNACKGQGWITMTKAQCAEKKGVWHKG